MNMPEMLTVEQTIKKIREQQPNSPIGEKTLRKWVKSNDIHYVTVGRRILISWASLVSFLTGEGA